MVPSFPHTLVEAQSSQNKIDFNNVFNNVLDINNANNLPLNVNKNTFENNNCISSLPSGFMYWKVIHPLVILFNC